MRTVVAALLVSLCGVVVCLDEFTSKMEFLQCVHTCERPISKCLRDIESACHKAYTACHDAENFITCLGSANGLEMQEIFVCMKEECTEYKEE